MMQFKNTTRRVDTDEPPAGIIGAFLIGMVFGILVAGWAIGMVLG
jgi:hypothetical protein